MPFANKFRAMMDLPVPGDTAGDFLIEHVDVSHAAGDRWGYTYDVRVVLRGPGGKSGVRRTFTPLLSKRVTTFSSYGNPYQLWFGKPEVASLGDRRYALQVEGIGVRIDLAGELERFLDSIAGQDDATDEPVPPVQLVESYLEQYRIEVDRRVARYRLRLKRTAHDGHHRHGNGL